MQILDIIPGMNTIKRKVSVSRVNSAGGFGGVMRPQWRQSTLWNVLDSIEHLDWFKIGLNVAKIITVQDYVPKKKMWMEIHIYNVNAKNQAGNI